MMEYINTHQAEFWFFAGFLLLVIDATVMGFASGVLLFVGIGGLITGALMWFGVLPQTWLAGISTFGISSGLTAVLLWKPLKKFQDKASPGKDNSSDLIGLSFVLESDISRSISGRTSYSGIEWRVEVADDSAEDNIPLGTRVVVSSVDAGLFRVKKQ